MELKPHYNKICALYIGTSNCTNMELKQITPPKLEGLFCSSNCTNMELKHHMLQFLEDPKNPSNCTNMELKHSKVSEAMVEKPLLITPIWN